MNSIDLDFDNVKLDFSAIDDAKIKMLMATGMSQSLIYALSRQYLDYSPTMLEKPKFLKADQPIDISMPSLIKLERIGRNIREDMNETLISLQTTLQMCHSPGRCQLVFLVTGNGKSNSIYLGVRSLDSCMNSDEFVEDYLGHWIESNWNGTKISYLPLKSLGKECLTSDILKKELSEFRSGIAITGIPSVKTTRQTGYPMSLDKLIAGLQNDKFAYLVIAEPLAEYEIAPLIFSCREMHSQALMINSINISNSIMQGIAETAGMTIGKTTTHGTSSGTSQKNIGPKALAALGIAAASAIFAPAAFTFALTQLAANPILASTGLSFIMNSFSVSNRSENESYSDTTSYNKSVTKSTSESDNFTINYVNSHVTAMSKYLEQYERRFEQSKAIGCWNVGVYILTKQPSQALFAGTQLKALMSGSESLYEPIRIHPLNWYWNNGTKEALTHLSQPSIHTYLTQNSVEIQHPFGNLYSGLTTPMNTEELSLLVNVPQQNVAGLPVIHVAGFSLPKENPDNSIKFATVLDRGKRTSINYSVPKNDFSKHVLVAGISGSGKSHTCKKILSEIISREIPFLVIEPAKEEYLHWALQYNKNLEAKGLEKDTKKIINVFVPGKKTINMLVSDSNSYKEQHIEQIRLKDNLRLNPFDVIWLSEEHEPNVLSHIDRLKACLISSLPMQDILPVLMEDLIYEVYQNASTDWLSKNPVYKKTLPPTLSGAKLHIDRVIAKKGYEERVRMNMTAALKTRIDSLRRGWKGELFDSKESCYSTPWEIIFDRPTVINLSHLGDESDRAFAMALILQFLYEYRQAQVEIGKIKLNQDELRHLTIIEEAHRVMPNVVRVAAGEINSQAKVSEMFSNMLSEIRAYGEGLLIAEQIPSRLIPDAIKNTNLKIVHRLVASDDKSIMAGCMNLKDEQTAILSKITRGQAIVCGENDDEAVWVEIYE